MKWGKAILPSGGSWKPVQDDGGADGGARLYIQAGSRMKDLPMDDDEAPF
jgi:replicative DNA helicase